MKSLVVYESIFGTTHQIASAIGAGLITVCEASVLPVCSGLSYCVQVTSAARGVGSPLPG